MKLYQTFTSPFPSRVRLLIYAKAITCELIEPPGFHSPAESKGDFAAINPMERVPVLVLDDGRALPESEVICEYLEDAFPTPSLRPETPWARAQARLLARICDVYLVMAMVPLFNVMGVPRAQRNADHVEAAMGKIREALGYIEAYIGTEGYAVEGRLTHADGAIAPQLVLAFEWAPRVFGVASPLGVHPKIAAYWQAIQTDPFVARIIAETREAIDSAIAQRGADRAPE